MERIPLGSKTLSVYSRIQLQGLVSPRGWFECHEQGWFGMVQPLVSGTVFHPELISQVYLRHHIPNFFLSLAESLSGLHRYGAVRGDIKPTNIMLCTGVPQLLDVAWTALGVAAPDGKVELQTMAPEQRAGDVPTQSSDQWSFALFSPRFYGRSPAWLRLHCGE